MQSMKSFISIDIIRLLPYIAATSFSLGLAIIAALTGGRKTQVRWFVAIITLESAWVISFVIEVYVSSLNAKLLWDALHWPLMVAVYSAIVMFALSYTCPDFKRPAPPVLVLLFAPVLIVLIAAILAILGAAGIMYERVGQTVQPFTELAARPSLFVYGLVAYGYALFVAAQIILIRAAVSRSYGSLPGIWFLLAGFGLQLLASILHFAFGAIMGSIWAAPVWQVIRNVLIVYGLFSDRLIGSLSKARRAVMDTLLDPVFVLGEKEVIVDCNAAACTLVGANKDSLIGSSARELFAGWPSSVSAALDFPEAETEIDLPDRDGFLQRYYRITVASSSAKDRSEAWKLLVFNDITGQKSDARDMAANNDELEFWVRQRTAALRQEVAQRSAAEDRLRELNEEMAKTQREILWTLSEVVESRSRETAYHVVRVGEYARILAQGYGMSPEEVEIITTAAPMHDVGKISIPDAILSKPGILTSEERDIMKHHTIVGKEILGSSRRPLLRAAAVIAHEHHERWDGKGYPEGKSGEAIDPSGRIVSLCDVFDALYTKRVYKDAWPIEKVLDLFRAESGAAFEPRLVDIFFERFDDILEVTSRFADATAPSRSPPV